MSYDLAQEVRVSYAAGEGNRVRIDLEEKYTDEEDWGLRDIINGYSGPAILNIY